MLKGGALLYAVFLTFLVSLITGFAILYAFYYNKYLDIAIIRNNLVSNVNSAIDLYLAGPEIVPSGQKKTISLFEEENSEVTLENKNWGAYNILVSSARWKSFSFSKTVMCGDNIYDDDEVALYLTDENNYISLCGKTILNGTCYLPKLGPRRAYIEGQSFIGSRLVNGELKTSANQLPGLNREFTQINAGRLSGNFNIKDSVFYFEEYNSKDSILNSFSNKTLRLISDRSVNLNYKIISGNIIISSKNPVIIPKNAIIEDIIIYAPSVIFKSGFRGKLQVFATDSIIVEKQCSLEYPSFICILNTEKKIKQPFIQIREKSEISGGVVLLNTIKDSKEHSKLSINKDVKIYGQVYCNDYVEHKGEIKGSLYCNKFILVTASAVYENHLLNAVIDIHGLSKHYSGCNLLDEANSKEVVKCLY